MHISSSYLLLFYPLWCKHAAMCQNSNQNTCPRGHLAVRKFLCQFNMLQFNAVLLLLCTKSFHLQTDDDNINRSVLLGNFEMHLYEMLLVVKQQLIQVDKIFWCFFEFLEKKYPLYVIFFQKKFGNTIDKRTDACFRHFMI